MPRVARTGAAAVRALPRCRPFVAAPVAFLRAGVGDAIAKKYEARGCLDGSGNTPLGTRPLLTGVAIADACFETIRRHAAAGLRDCEAGEVTPDVGALPLAPKNPLPIRELVKVVRNLDKGQVPIRDAGGSITRVQLGPRWVVPPLVRWWVRRRW